MHYIALMPRISTSQYEFSPYINGINHRSVAWELFPSRNGYETWSGQDIHLEPNIIFRATSTDVTDREKQKNRYNLFYYKYYEHCYYVSIDGGQTFIEGFADYGFKDKEPTVFNVIKKAVDSEMKKQKNIRNKELAKARKQVLLKEAEQLGISVEDLAEQKKKEYLEKKEQKAVVRDVKDMQNRIAIATELAGVADKINLVLTKIQNNEDVKVGNSARKVENIKNFKHVLNKILSTK